MYCAVFIVWCGCVSQRNPIHANATPVPGPSGGYPLLFELLRDEKNVSKLLVIKRERAELKALINEIAATAARASKQLETFAKADPSLDLKSQGLPAAEVETRASIATQKGKELLVEGGKEFELNLLLSQSQALTYAAHLAETMAKSEANQTRAAYLRQLAGDLHALRRKVEAMLLANYRWPAQ